MGTSGAARRLVWASILLLVGASAGVGVLWGAAGRALPARPRAEAEEAVAGGAVEIIAPEQDARLRGMATVRVEWPSQAGFVIFRVDGDFLYATTRPFVLRWDTSGISDGEHVLDATAYDKDGNFAGSSSVRVYVENAIPAPTDGLLLQVKFTEADALTRSITARGELSALRSNQVLPEGFDVLSGTLQAEITQSVLDAYYEGATALVRNRLRAGAITVGGARRDLPEQGGYAMVQVSRNGLAIPVAGGTRTRLGLGEISLALADYPLLPGDSWEAPVGVVCDLYTRQAIYVHGRHTFEGLRWFQGRECGVVTSSYQLPDVPLMRRAEQTASVAGSAGYEVGLTQMAGGMRGGMMGGMGMRGGVGMRGGMAGQAGMRPGAAGQAAAPGAAARTTPGTLESARLTDLEGERVTYITRTGRVLYTQDTIRGRVEFRASAARTAALPADQYQVALAQMAGGMRGGMMGGMGMRGGVGMRGGMAGQAGMRAGAAGQAAGRTPTAAGRQAGEAAQEIPSSLDYGLRLTTQLVVP